MINEIDINKIKSGNIMNTTYKQEYNIAAADESPNRSSNFENFKKVNSKRNYSKGLNFSMHN